MLREACYVGQKVYFGRTHGEQTLGEIVKLNPTKAKVRTLEARGSRGLAGRQWGVPYSMLKLADEDVVVPAKPEPLTYSPFDADNDILQVIAGVYNELSPENISCDGELSRSRVQQRYKECQRKVRGLQIALGRNISEDQAMDWHLSKMEYERARKAKA
jgi:hypothetical protein